MGSVDGHSFERVVKLKQAQALLNATVPLIVGIGTYTAASHYFPIQQFNCARNVYCTSSDVSRELMSVSAYSSLMTFPHPFMLSSSLNPETVLVQMITNIVLFFSTHQVFQ